MLGDFTPAKTVVCRFNTHKADGTPITLAGTPACSVYKNSTTESTTGVTLTVDYDSRTGLHSVVVDTSADGTFYAAANDFDIVITTGTVDSISVVGTVVGTFSLSNRSALRPTTADRTLVVDAAGLADANAVKVGPTGSGTAQTARDLGQGIPNAVPGAAGGLLIAGSNAATTFATLTSTGAFTINGTSNVAQTGDSFARIGVAGVGLTNVVLPSGGLANVTAWTVAITGNITGNLSGSAGSVTGAVGSVTARVTANTDQLAGQTVTAAAGVTFPSSVASPTNITAGTITTATNVTTVNGLAANVITATSIASGAITAAKFAANAIDAAALAADAGTEIATAVWASATRTLTATSDPWTTALPGAYGAGTAGFIVGTYLTNNLLVMTNDYGGGTFTVENVTGSVSGNVFGSVASIGTGGITNTSYANGAIDTTAAPLLANLDAAVSSRLSAAAYTTPPTAAAIATAWGASVVGNSRTRDYFLQGGTNKVAFDVPGAGQYTIYQTDDTASLKVGTYTAAAVDPVTVLDPA